MPLSDYPVNSTLLSDDRPKRHNMPPISLYFVSDDDPVNMAYKLSCMFCKRTIADQVKGRIDKAISTPMPADDFDLAINLQCKLCGQKWRFLGSPITT